MEEIQKCINSLEKIFVNEKFGIKYYTNRAIYDMKIKA